MNAKWSTFRGLAGWWIAACLFCLDGFAWDDVSLNIDGLERVARVEAPSGRQDHPLPLVLAFHGYEDERHNFARYVALHKAWPGAIVVYPQGERLPDAEGSLRGRGWQTHAGDEADRDLALVDALLTHLASLYRLDASRIYATGMSNGGRFVFLLWAQRPQRFAAFAPVGTSATRDALSGISQARPVLYMIGRQEPRRWIEAATETVDVITRVNLASAGSEPWGEYLRFIPFENGADFVFNLHKAGHVWPAHASSEIVRFFRQFTLEAVSD